MHRGLWQGWIPDGENWEYCCWFGYDSQAAESVKPANQWAGGCHKSIVILKHRPPSWWVPSLPHRHHRTVDFKLSGNPLADSFSLNSDWAIFDLLAPWHPHLSRYPLLRLLIILLPLICLYQHHQPLPPHFTFLLLKRHTQFHNQPNFGNDPVHHFASIHYNHTPFHRSCG